MKRIPNIICQPPEVHFIGIISLSPSQLLCIVSYLIFKGGPSGKNTYRWEHQGIQKWGKLSESRGWQGWGPDWVFPAHLAFLPPPLYENQLSPAVIPPSSLGLGIQTYGNDPRGRTRKKKNKPLSPLPLCSNKHLYTSQELILYFHNWSFSSSLLSQLSTLKYLFPTYAFPLISCIKALLTGVSPAPLCYLYCRIPDNAKPELQENGELACSVLFHPSPTSTSVLWRQKTP